MGINKNTPVNNLPSDVYNGSIKVAIKSRSLVWEKSLEVTAQVIISINTITIFIILHHKNLLDLPVRFTIEIIFIVFVIIGLVKVLISRGLKIRYDKSIEREGYDKRVRLCRHVQPIATIFGNILSILFYIDLLFSN